MKALSTFILLAAVCAFWNAQPASGRAGGRVPAPVSLAKTGARAHSNGENAKLLVATPGPTEEVSLSSEFEFEPEPETEPASAVVNEKDAGTGGDAVIGKSEDEPLEEEDEYYDEEESEDENDEDEDDRDGCGALEIRYFRSGLCVPAKCPRGLKRDGATGRCDPKPGSGDYLTGAGVGVGLLGSGSGSIYTYGRTKYKTIRTGRYRVRKIAVDRPRKFARWYKEANPDVAGRKPMA